MTAYKVEFMNFFALNSASTAAHGATLSISAEPFGREKLTDGLPGRRMKWPFSVAVPSADGVSAQPRAGVANADDSDTRRFVT